MKSLAIRCRLCGHDNLFPLKYAGRTLSCSHCGESLPVVQNGEASPITAVPLSADPSSRESGLRRLTKAISFLLCMVSILTLGIIGGGLAGFWLAFETGFLGFILVWLTCPAGGFFGLWLARWLGQGLARLMSSYRLTFWGLLLGMGGGVLYWSQTVDDSSVRLLSGELGFQQWLALSLAVTIGGLLVGLVAMIVDALTNFTR